MSSFKDNSEINSIFNIHLVWYSIVFIPTLTYKFFNFCIESRITYYKEVLPPLFVEYHNLEKYSSSLQFYYDSQEGSRICNYNIIRNPKKSLVKQSKLFLCHYNLVDMFFIDYYFRLKLQEHGYCNSANNLVQFYNDNHNFFNKFDSSNNLKCIKNLNFLDLWFIKKFLIY